MSKKALKDKKSGKQLGAQAVGATALFKGKKITPKSVKNAKTTTPPAVIEAPKAKIEKKAESKKEESPLRDILKTLGDCFAAYGGDKSGAVDAYFADLWNEGLATPEGEVILGGKKYDLRTFEKIRKGKEAKTQQFRKTISINGKNVDVIIWNK